MTTELSQVKMSLECAVADSRSIIVASLAARFRDIQLVEEAFSNATFKAMESWPRDGIPKNTEGWLYRVAQNDILNTLKHSKVANRGEDHLQLLHDESFDSGAHLDHGLLDERLKLLFVCAHPAIDERSRTPLMLQIVLGLRTEAIASAFLASPAAMAKQLVRAKQKIRSAGIPFLVPSEEQLQSRLQDVLEAIYGAYNHAWDSIFSEQDLSIDLQKESLFLASLVTKLLPEEPEPKGLLALILFCESRSKARRSDAGDFLPLNEQDTQLWDRDLINRGEAELKAAFKIKRIGRFQLEAAIQSAHCARRLSKLENWQEIITLYRGLNELSQTVGSSLGLCAALLDAGDTEGSQKVIDEIAHLNLEECQPYWAVLGEVMLKRGHQQEAVQAFSRALGLTKDGAIRNYFLKKIDSLSAELSRISEY